MININMNFKTEKIKVIGSIVIPIILWILVITIGSSFKSPPEILINFFVIHNISNIFSLGNIFLFLIEVAIVYIIWSLFQKKTEMITSPVPQVTN